MSIAGHDNLIDRTVSHYDIREKLGGWRYGGGLQGGRYSPPPFRGSEVSADNVAKDAQALARFQREAQAASALDHPNIYTIYDFGEQDGKAFIAMAYLDGATLKHKITGRPTEWMRSYGRKLIFAKGSDLFVAEADGRNAQKLITAPGLVFNASFSAHGKWVRFDVDVSNQNSHSLWEAGSNGSNLHRLLPGWHISTCCGKWTPDGRYYVFSSGSDIWALREGWFFFFPISELLRRCGLRPGRWCIPVQRPTKIAKGFS